MKTSDWYNAGIYLGSFISPEDELNVATRFEASVTHQYTDKNELDNCSLSFHYHGQCDGSSWVGPYPADNHRVAMRTNLTVSNRRKHIGWDTDVGRTICQYTAGCMKGWDEN